MLYTSKATALNSLKVKSQGKVVKALHHNSFGPLKSLRPSRHPKKAITQRGSQKQSEDLFKYGAVKSTDRNVTG